MLISSWQRTSVRSDFVGVEVTRLVSIRDSLRRPLLNKRGRGRPHPGRTGKTNAKTQRCQGAKNKQRLPCVFAALRLCVKSDVGKTDRRHRAAQNHRAAGGKPRAPRPAPRCPCGIRNAACAPSPFVPTEQPEISQTRSVWFTVQIETRPEGTAESFDHFHRRSATQSVFHVHRGRCPRLISGAASRLGKLDAQTTSAHDARDAADVVTTQVNQLVVNAVKGDPAHGEDSDLYEAMGYVRKSARKSGLTRKKAAVAAAAK